MGGHRVYHEGEIDVNATALPIPAPEPEPVDATSVLTDEERAELVEEFAHAGYEDLTLFLTAIGAESTDDLTSDQADDLRRLLSERMAEATA
jgi:hypothetical protein